eukprot:5585959-Prymnesium_polylepis.1
MYTDREKPTMLRPQGMNEDVENRNRAERMNLGRPTGSYQLGSLVRTLLSYDEVVRLEIEDFVPGANTVKHSGTSIRLVSQGKQMVRCLALMEAFVRRCRGGVNYELVMRTRPDIGYPANPPFPFEQFLELNRAERRKSLRDILFVPLSDDSHEKGLNDQIAVAVPQGMRENVMWGDVASHLNVVSTHEEAMRRQVMTMVKGGNFTLKRFWYEYSLVRPRDAYLFGYLGPDIWSHYNNNPYIWRKTKCNPGYEAVNVSTPC